MFLELLALSVFIAIAVFNVAPGGDGKLPEKSTVVSERIIENRSAKADWVEVFKSDKITLYADPSRLLGNGYTVKMWRLSDYKLPEINGDHVYLSKKLYEEYDCQKEQHRLLFVALYHDNMGTGGTLYTRAETYSWAPVLPDTEDEAMWEIACAEN